MSTFKVEVVRVDGVIPHPGADRLDLVKINDWQCVSTKGNFKPGDLAIYFPIDSILPEEVESKIFGAEAKVKLTNSRVKTIKLRGAISQGLAVAPETLGLSSKVGTDVTKQLGIIKYEAPVKTTGATSSHATKKSKTNPYFKKYGGIENAKNYPNLFVEGEQVIVTEKIHGSNVRCGWVPYYPNTLFKKIMRTLRLSPKYEFVYGSNNVQLQDKFLYSGYYDVNHYAKIVKIYNLKDVLQPGEVLYGEVYGPEIQKGYGYDCKSGEVKGIFFDLKKDDKFLSFIEFEKWAKQRGLPVVPRLYTGPFNKEKILALRDGPSVICSKQLVREGVVVKPMEEQHSYIGRKFLKFISDTYLLKNQDNESNDA